MSISASPWTSGSTPTPKTPYHHWSWPSNKTSDAKDKKQPTRPGRKKNATGAATQTGDQTHTTPTLTTNGTPA